MEVRCNKSFGGMPFGGWRGEAHAGVTLVAAIVSMTVWRLLMCVAVMMEKEQWGRKRKRRRRKEGSSGGKGGATDLPIPQASYLPPDIGNKQTLIP